MKWKYNVCDIFIKFTNNNVNNNYNYYRAKTYIKKIYIYE